MKLEYVADDSIAGYGSKDPSEPIAESDWVGPALEDGLRRALRSLEWFPCVSVVRFAGKRLAFDGSPAAASGVDLYRVELGIALPIGVGDAATQVRRALCTGFDGWTLPVLPDKPEPLAARRSRLSSHTFGTLTRHHFRSVEEIELLPDEVLVETRGMGSKSLAALREVIPARDPTLPVDTVSSDPDGLNSAPEATTLGEIHKLLRSINEKLDKLLDGTPSRP